MLINDEIQRQVLPVLARATVVPEGEIQQRAGAQLQLNPGQQVKAEIIANLPNNLYLARIAGEMFKLEIPLNVQPGETMEMTFVSADPRITFQVMRPVGGGESVSLSSMGKWLSSVARDAPSGGGTSGGGAGGSRGGGGASGGSRLYLESEICHFKSLGNPPRRPQNVILLPINRRNSPRIAGDSPRPPTPHPTRNRK